MYFMSHRALGDQFSEVPDTSFGSQVSTDGGATRRVSDGKRAPDSGYYVSTPHHEERIWPTPGPQDIGKAASKHMQGLRTAGAPGYQGGWHSEHEDAVYLDNTQRYTHPGVAMAEAHAGKQQEIYDANAKRTVKVREHNPLSDKRLPSRKQLKPENV